MAAQTMVLIGAGSVVLIVISVVATVFLVNRTPSKPAAATTAAAKTPAALSPKIESTKEEAPITPIVIAAPIITPVRPSDPAAITPTPVVAAPSEIKPTIPKVTAPATATALRPTPSSAIEPDAKSSTVLTVSPAVPVASPVVPAAPATAADHTESIHAFLDAIRLKGVRATGADSRVLLNEHVYRLNDVVDRSLGLRLTKVESGKLTFTDANGVVYEKLY